MTDTRNTIVHEQPDEPVWTATGLEWVPEERRVEFLLTTSELDFSAGEGMEVDVESGYALVALSRQFDLPMTRVSTGLFWQAPHGEELATYKVVALETDYKNGTLRTVALDTGAQVAVVFSRFIKKRLVELP